LTRQRKLAVFEVATVIGPPALDFGTERQPVYTQLKYISFMVEWHLWRFTSQESRPMKGGRKNMVDVLRKAIRDSGMTHYRLAKDAGIKPSQLDFFMDGERTLTVETAAKVADVLGLELTRRKP
jgi:hypothetical protein